MKTKKVISFILEILTCIAYVVGGIFVIVVHHHSDYTDGNMLGIILMICGVLKLIKFFFSDGSANLIGLTAGIVAIPFGFIFFFGELDIFHMCLLWGLYEIVFGSLEIVEAFKDRHINTVEIFTILIAASELVFGALLCINTIGGVGEHLVYIGITLILTSLSCVINILQKRNIFFKSNKSEEETNKTDA